MSARAVTFEEFSDEVDRILVLRDLSDQRADGLDGGREGKREPFDGLVVRWVSGGVSGGTCWESSRSRAYSTDAEPAPLSSLSAVLEDFVPELRYLSFRRIESLVVSDSWSLREYYGNRTDYGRTRIALRDLYDVLVAEGLLEAP
jgi:hypothetical protein